MVSIFKNVRKGSSRTEKIKLRHQDLQYEIQWKKGTSNKADYLSRHAIPWNKVPAEEKKETGECEKLIWFVQFSPYIEAISVQDIIRETKKDKVLKVFKKSLEKGYASKKEEALKPFIKIWDHLSMTAEGLILKDYKIILPEALKEVALIKAHQGSHPGITTMKRCIRTHFFFPDLSARVTDLVRNCDSCTMYNPKTRSPMI